MCHLLTGLRNVWGIGDTVLLMMRSSYVFFFIRNEHAMRRDEAKSGLNSIVCTVEKKIVYSSKQSTGNVSYQPTE
jgi:hypothetical protein